LFPKLLKILDLFEKKRILLNLGMLELDNRERKLLANRIDM